MKSILFWLLLILSTTSYAENLTLEQIRQELEGQQVMILGRAFSKLPSELERFNNPTANKLVGWFDVDGDAESGFKRKKGAGTYAPLSIRGQTALVVRVEERDTSLRPRRSGSVDVFGKPISDSDVKNPAITVIVRMADGATHYGTWGYYTTLIGKTLQLMSTIERNRIQITNYLESLSGKNLYKFGYTDIYKADSDLSDLLDLDRRPLNKDYTVENLTPMKVLETKYLEGENSVILKVSLPSGATKILFGDLTNYEPKYSNNYTLLELMGINTFDNVPKKFSPRELAAIKNSEIFRGMSKDALFASWGYPEKTNDWGKGGKQYIYANSRYVYLQGNAISDWQSIR